MRYNHPSKKEMNFISDKISIISNEDYYKIISNKNITNKELLIIEYPDINLFGLENINREEQILQLYLKNKDNQLILDLYPRSTSYTLTSLIKKMVHGININKSINKNINKNIVELFAAKYIFNAFEGNDYGPLTLPIIAKTNHSCKPNARFRFNRETGSMHLFAIRDIKKNEEIYVSYLENKKIDNHRLYLQEHYGFICNC